ncbi:MAG: hypothetical protein A3I11_04125 [Elusimicrobia bacterium RIFCSPLOWO2_02_FULL_39_32]|nr:MAG: hypothetical protein A2034_05515 [Elusimicrobia bacterium GWA2_38_7]OGR79561.1 MAG: hypothetical protein A3B80_02700 [Elusimicrobia bacterium RIFCSPHIGHO2_02_FULL_39_36]OGR92887.1 MAG: hypothetical protein A3I11_04125 [Elusimicrobia bacterium RIFCSPLOWO2_02_FULL_39_32]OGR99671.1 MAG: hypothetical protein A3G85_01490 [Elusimicrobia bacterium RIFCSPLOWO2_12_FULL_39_28]
MIKQENQRVRYNAALAFFQSLIEKKRTICIIFLITIAIGTIISVFRPKVYRATSVLNLGYDKIHYWGIEDYLTITKLFEQEYLLRQVASKLNLSENPISIVKSKFRFRNLKSSLVAVDGLGKTPEEALRISELLASLILERHRYLLSAREENIKLFDQTVVVLEDEIQSLRLKIENMKEVRTETQALLFGSLYKALGNKENRLQNYRSEVAKEKIEYNMLTTRLEIPAVLPVKPIKPNFKINFLISLIYGLFLSFAWVLIIKR